MIGKAVSIKFSSCTVISTGDLLAGKTGATRHEILDAMIAHWMSDPVQGTKTGYSKLAMKLAERVEADLVPKTPAKKAPSKKRVASPEASSTSSSSSSQNIRGRGGLDSGRRDSSGSRIPPQPEGRLDPQLHSWRTPRRWRPRPQLLLEPDSSVLMESPLYSCLYNRVQKKS
jgi:hypothetical protein